MKKEPAGAEMAAVIVHYGPWAATRRAVASFRRHAPDVRVVVVDNDPAVSAPGDIEAEIVKSPGNSGYGAACNLGARRIGSPLLIFANNDVEISPGSVGMLREALRSDSRAAAAGPSFTRTDLRVTRSLRRAPSPWRVWSENLFLPRLFPYVPLFHGHHTAFARERTVRPAETLLGAFFLIRRDAFEEVGGFDEAYFFYAEEADLFTRLRGRGWRVLFEPRARVMHAEGVASATVSRETLDEWLYDALRRYARTFHGARGERMVRRALRAGARLRWLLSFAPGLPDRLARRARYAAILRFQDRRSSARDAAGKAGQPRPR